LRLSKDKRALFERWNYAHRGLHTEDKTIPENSLTAFQRAAEKGYGAELDVQLTKDGQVVVFHDDTLNRVCHVDGRVDAYTLAELKKMSLCNTKETIPLFTEVLEIFGQGNGPLIVELKTGPNNNELCEKTYEILKSYKGVYCIESFNPLIVKWFKDHAPEVVRGQLASQINDYKDQNIFLKFLLSRCLFSIVNHPHFIAYRKGKRPYLVRRQFAHGAMAVAWTSHEPDVEQQTNDAVIFEFYEPNPRY